MNWARYLVFSGIFLTNGYPVYMSVWCINEKKLSLLAAYNTSFKEKIGITTTTCGKTVKQKY